MSNIFPNYIVIEQIKYHKKTNKIEIYVTSDDFIKEEIILEKTVQIKEELSLNELEIISSYKISSDDTDKLKRYENILRVRINETFPSTKELNGHLLINYNKENNCYNIIIVKSAIYNLLMKKDAQNVLNKIIKKQINLDITANIILDEEEIDMQEYEKNQELENTSITANLINVKEVKQEKQKTQDASKKVEIKGESV
ncbi:MAG: PolC-type DNA polymerase III, partial [Peptoanaerobacter stomatis]